MSIFQSLTSMLTKLPGVGPKGAERIVLALLKRPATVSQDLGRALTGLHQSIITCALCHTFVDKSECVDSLCILCRDPKRAHRELCVVSETIDQERIEETGAFQGIYHVLGGLLDPLEGITADDLTMRSLFERIKIDPPQEIILALNPDIRGETTALYIEQQLLSYRERGGIIAKLARGLPSTATIEYADPLTLTQAFNGRSALSTNTPGIP